MTVTPFPAAEPFTKDDVSPEFSEDALALEFTSRHGHQLRYYAQWGTWLEWGGTRWKFEKTLHAFDLARVVAREFSNAPKGPGTKIANSKTVAAIEKLARADRRHAATVDIWDADPWLLNTPAGIVNLQTGKMMLHDSARYITKITTVSPDGVCPRWLQFLDEITGSNKELQLFLRRIAGYSLTGITKEHSLFFAYGTGGNGKGVFLNTLSAILAEYAAVAPMETFISTQTEKHPTDLAGLRGARLVTSQETEEGRRWAESKIKALTGGDPISARFMRQDFFTYTPAFKLWVAGNHKPGLRGVDEAIRRRFHLIPFTVTIANPDRELSDKLKTEWPGILRWAIDGCLEWQRIGLSPPEAVREATAAYLGDEDALARWVEDCCITGRNQWCASSVLWPSWQRWAAAAGETVGSHRRFGMALESHGYQPERTMAIRGYRGLDLNENEKRAGAFSGACRADLNG
jgi:putative DNA primase/helicase